MTKTEKLDIAVAEYCDLFKMAKPMPWCYPGDLILDTSFNTFLICGDNPKDVAELRRRRLTYKKIDFADLENFINKWIDITERTPDIGEVRIKMIDGSELNVLTQLDGDFWYKHFDAFIARSMVTHWRPRKE